jgi:hypothetical protein
MIAFAPVGHVGRYGPKKAVDDAMTLGNESTEAHVSSRSEELLTEYGTCQLISRGDYTILGKWVTVGKIDVPCC